MYKRALKTERVIVTCILRETAIDQISKDR